MACGNQSSADPERTAVAEVSAAATEAAAPPGDPATAVAPGPAELIDPDAAVTQSPEEGDALARFAAASATEQLDPDAFARINPDGPREVNPRQFRQLLSRDAIVPVYEPKVVPADEAGIEQDDLVIGVALNGESRAYPIRMMRFREIANDEVGGVPVLVTW